MPSPAPPARPPARAAASRRTLVLVAGCVAALGLVAAIAFVAGSATRSTEPAATDPSVVAAAPGGHAGHGGDGGGGLELYAVQAAFGTVVTDGEGRVLYGSDQDGNAPAAARCAGACARGWEPLVVPAGVQPDLLGVGAAAVGRVTRGDGSSQLTLGGWPVYVNEADDGALKSAVKGGSGWFALGPQGDKVPV